MRMWWLLPGVVLLALPAMARAELTVVSTSPAAGAQEVDPNISEVRIRFSAPVRSDYYAILSTDQGRRLRITGRFTFEEEGLVCVVPVKLWPGVTYSFSVNSEKFRTFRSAEDPTVTVTPYIVTFKTSGEARLADWWREDLAYLASTLPARHKNLFFQLPEEQFREQVADLDKRMSTLSEEQIVIELMKLVASAGDAHTHVEFWEPLGATVLPLEVYWFEEGIFVVGASEEYRQALGCRVRQIGGMEIESACQALSGIVSHENEAKVKDVVPRLLVLPRVLAALGIVADPGKVSLDLVASDGREVSVEVNSVGASSVKELATVLDEAKGPVPAYRQRPDETYWVGYLERENAVYLQYNRCSEVPSYPISRLQADTEKLLEEHDGARLVIDLRHNGGGNSTLLDPFIAALKEMPRFEGKGRLFVIVGRRTFSSALLNAISLRDNANAIVVGEPTGGKLNHYGEVKSFTLPNSGLPVYYSTEFFQESAVDTPSLMPDIAAEVRYAEYVAGVDAAMEGIVRYGADVE